MAENFDKEKENIKGLDFDEKLEIEKLQATIKSMSNFSDDSEGFLSQSPQALMEGSALGSMINEEDYDPYAEIEKPVISGAAPRAKKFVVMVNPENVEYFDNLEMDERTQVFNKLLSEYIINSKKEKRKTYLIKFSKHMFVSLLTILISLPIMFLVVNKSIQLTVKNYKEVQNNFEKLYESKNYGRFKSNRKTIY
jgi:Fe2+ transport system protein B